MKNRYLFRMISLLAATLLCLTACAGGGAQDSRKAASVKKNKVEKVHFEQIWKYDEELEQDVEFGIITGKDSEGETVWDHVTDRYPIGQDDVVAEVLYTRTQYIFCENGTLISLDIPTGEVLWENSGFDGYGVCGVEAENGNLYFCGYLGTSFFAVDSNGKTLHKIESFGDEYGWAHDIRMDGDKIMITLGLGPEELRGPDGFVMIVDPVDYSFALK